jgi:hypothetical protein
MQSMAKVGKGGLRQCLKVTPPGDLPQVCSHASARPAPVAQFRDHVTCVLEPQDKAPKLKFLI